MKTLNITFTDSEFRRMKKFKDPARSWHDFILKVMKGGLENGNNDKQ